MIDVFRLLGGLVFIGLASLTLVTAPTRLLWGASLAATEWGYWLACAALLPLIPTRTQRGFGKLGAVLSLAAIAMFVTPTVRAWQMNAALPATFDASFGTERRARTHASEEPRTVPLVVPELLKPLTLPTVRFEERVFATHGDQKLTLDIYHPAYVHAPLPGVIVVHGGAWQSGDNDEFVALNGYLAGRDYVVAAIDYRLAPRWRFPAARDDVLSAIGYLKVYAPEFGLDPTRLALMGRSAGGQLALLAAYTAGEPAIRGVISVYGPTDLRFAYDHPSAAGLIDTREVLETYLGGPPASAADAYFAASPVNFVTATSPPTLLIHGMRDGMVSPDESVRLEEKLRQSAVRHLFVRMPWATHACDKSFGGPCGQIATYSIERFLDGVMAAPPADNRRPGSDRNPVKRAAR
jgi:acetyl esterase/lipase